MRRVNFDRTINTAEYAKIKMRHGRLQLIRRYPYCLQIGTVLLLLLFALIPSFVGAQDDVSALRALFPKTNEIAGWTLMQEPKLYVSGQVFDYMDGAGEIPRSYDLRQLMSARYTQGKVTLELVAFDMGRSENAFGYCSARAFLERSPTAKERVIAIDNPAHLYTAVGILTLWKGRYTVIVQPDLGKPDERTLVDFGRFVSHRIKDRGNLPPLIRQLRPRGAGVGTAGESLRYLRGKAAFDTLLLFTPQDAFGATKGAEAVAAEFSVMGAPATLCVVRYPDAGAAAAAYSNFHNYLPKMRGATMAVDQTPKLFIGITARFKAVGMLAAGRFLVVVVGAKDARTAEAGLRSLRAVGEGPSRPISSR
jgi:hypothetical protein